MDATQPTNQSSAPDRTAAVLGGILVLVGVLFLIAQLTNFDLGQYGWPLFVIVPGVAMLTVALTSRSLAGFAIPGSIVTMTGLVLAAQNSLNLWASWSYAWALIFPTAIGVGTLLLGLRRGDPKEVRNGSQAILVGLSLFAVFAVFFEGLLHVDGVALGSWANVVLPVVLIVAGVFLLGWRLMGQGRDQTPV